MILSDTKCTCGGVQEEEVNAPARAESSRSDRRRAASVVNFAADRQANFFSLWYSSAELIFTLLYRTQMVCFERLSCLGIQTFPDIDYFNHVNSASAYLYVWKGLLPIPPLRTKKTEHGSSVLTASGFRLLTPTPPSN